MATAMRANVGLAIALLAGCGSGCGDGDDGQAETASEVYSLTSGGLQYRIVGGTKIGSDYTEADAAGWLDIRVTQWKDETHRLHGFPKEQLNQVIAATRFTLVDDWQMESPAGVGNPPVAGWTYGDGRVLACIWSYEQWRKADPYMGLWVVKHEMDHRLGIIPQSLACPPVPPTD